MRAWICGLHDNPPVLLLTVKFSLYSLFDKCFLPHFNRFVQNLYDSIKNEPFKIPEDDGNDLTHTFFNPDREGWLLKLGTYRLFVTMAQPPTPRFML